MIQRGRTQHDDDLAGSRQRFREVDDTELVDARELHRAHETGVTMESKIGKRAGAPPMARRKPRDPPIRFRKKCPPDDGCSVNE